MITIKDQKDILLPKVKKVFENNGFKLFKGSPLFFRKFTECCVFTVGFDFSKNGGSGNSLMSITILSVESIIMEIGLPTNKLIAQKTGKDFLTTILDKKTPFEFTHQVQTFGTYARRIRTIEDCTFLK